MFYRIQQPEHRVEMLLDPECQYSTSYCHTDEYGEPAVRHGVSVCDSLESLASYFAQTGVPLSADCSLVTLDGDWSDEDDEDSALGALLIIPTEIVSVEFVTDEFFELVSAAYDSMN